MSKYVCTIRLVNNYLQEGTVCSEADEVYELDGARVIRRTAKAIMVQIKGETFWIPKSVVEEEFRGSVLVEFWWLKKSGNLSKLEAARSPFGSSGDATAADLTGRLEARLAA